MSTTRRERKFTHFKGPMRAGTIVGTGGIELGSNVSNVGHVICAQSDLIQEEDCIGVDSCLTKICIPAKSQIVNITLLVTTAWDSTWGFIYIGDGTVVEAGTFRFGYFVGTSVGLKDIIFTQPPHPPAGTQVGYPANWKNVGNLDVHISVTVNGFSTSTDGLGVLTVEYIQGNNLT